MINDELEKAYSEILKAPDFSKLRALSKQDPTNLSNIFLAKIDNVNAKLKILVIGKETRKWKGALNDTTWDNPAYVKVMLNYSKAGVSAKAPKSAFLNWLKKSESKINKNATHETTIVWCNLFCLAENGKSPQKNSLIDDIQNLSKQLLIKQIEIIKPNFIVFATGAGYDKYIKNYFTVAAGHLGVETVPKRLWQFEILNTPCIRVTHPQFRAGKDTRDAAMAIVKNYIHEQANYAIAS